MDKIKQSKPVPIELREKLSILIKDYPNFYVFVCPKDMTIEQFFRRKRFY